THRAEHRQHQAGRTNIQHQPGNKIGIKTLAALRPAIANGSTSQHRRHHGKNFGYHGAHHTPAPQPFQPHAGFIPRSFLNLLPRRYPVPEPSSPAVLSPPDLSWRADGQPVSEQFNDPYFSVDNGLEESRYVFLQHNGLPQRWQDWPWTQQPAFCIVETGFGTGLNFLLTWDSWLKRGHNDGWRHFTSVEKYPLTR